MTIADHGWLGMFAMVFVLPVTGCGAGSARSVGDRSFALSTPERAQADAWDAQAPTDGPASARCAYWEDRARQRVGGDEQAAAAARRAAGLTGYAQARADVACGRVTLRASGDDDDRHAGTERSRHR